jgi:hypothetical protein
VRERERQRGGRPTDRRRPAGSSLRPTGEGGVARPWRAAGRTGEGAPGNWRTGHVGQPWKRNGVGRARRNNDIFYLFKRISNHFDSF